MGAVHKWELPFPHFLYPFVGAFRPFATSIPPLLDRGWGQRKPDSSYLPAPVFPPRDGRTDSLLAINRRRDWYGRLLPLPLTGLIPLQLVVVRDVILPLCSQLRGHRVGSGRAMDACAYPAAPSNLPFAPAISCPPSHTHRLRGYHPPPCGEGQHPRVGTDRSEPIPLPLWCVHTFRISQEKVLEPLGRDKGENHKRNT